ncbi:MAG: hypothetical protein ACFFAH_00895 [Promethearchaeota archaeon]
MLKTVIKGNINAKTKIIGKGVHIEEGVVITGKEGPMEELVLGDFCYIGNSTKIIMPKFRLGDYSKLNEHSFLHGEKPMQIGRNCWIGGHVVLDSMGGLDIDDNVGIGAQSQIWTHIQFGDIVEGCRFYSKRYMLIEKDVWFVGHCIISPVRVGTKSMALVGSVITHDMKPNHVYGGVPAKDLTDKVGPQFEDYTIDQKASKLQKLIDDFINKYPKYKDKLKVVQSADEIEDNICCFDVSRRIYTKRYLEAEIKFLKAYVPLIKFIPENENTFIIPQK